MIQLQVFISSYMLYNTQGGLAGKWWDISDYSNLDDLYSDVIADLNERGDIDPEIMALDTDGDDLKIYEESGIAWIAKYFEAVEAVENGIEADHLVSLYRENYTEGSPISEAINDAQNFYGIYENKLEFSRDHFENLNLELPSIVKDNIDFESYAKDLEGSYTIVDSYNNANKVLVFSA